MTETATTSRKSSGRKSSGKPAAAGGWVVYILSCGDGALYTGIAKDMDRRLAQHRKGTGAKFTRGRGPLELVYAEKRRTRGSAQKREAQIKALTRSRKLALVAAGPKRKDK